MTDKEAKELDDIRKNQESSSNDNLVTQLMLHLIGTVSSLSDKVSSLNASSDKTQSEIHAVNKRIDDSNKRIDDSNKRTDAKITSVTSATEVKLIKWIVGTDIALAGVIIAFIHYFG